MNIRQYEIATDRLHELYTDKYINEKQHYRLRQMLICSPMNSDIEELAIVAINELYEKTKR